MKKVLVTILVVLVVVVVAAVVLLGLFLDKAIKAGVETVGTKLTQVDVKLEKVELSVLSGGGAVHGLVVGNPKGYKTPMAIRVGEASLAVKPTSLLSDKIVVKHIVVRGPEITFEGDLGGNNLNQISKNLEATTGGPSTSAQTAEASGPSKKLQVDLFEVTDGKVTINSSLLGGKSITVTLPNIKLSDLGTGPEGVTAAELTKVLLSRVTKESVMVAGKELARAGKEAVGAATESGKQTIENTKKAAQGVTDLFKKK